MPEHQNEFVKTTTFSDGDTVKTPRKDAEIIVTYSGEYGRPANEDDYLSKLDEAASRGCQVMYVTEQYDSQIRQEETNNLTWLDGSGNISCLVTPAIEPIVECWLQDRGKHQASPPKEFDPEFSEFVELLQYETRVNDLSRTSLAAE